jgi:hypothetical protein
MRSLFEPDARAACKQRLAALTPDSQARWGRMNASQMVCHVGDQLRIAMGDLAVDEKPILLRFKPLRRVFIYWLPWPKGKIPTSPAMQTTLPGDWDADVAATGALVDRFATVSPAGEWAVHPAFGRLSGEEWGELSWKHLDYHLGQFGV